MVKLIILSFRGHPFFLSFLIFSLITFFITSFLIIFFHFDLPTPNSILLLIVLVIIMWVIVTLGVGAAELDSEVEIGIGLAVELLACCSIEDLILLPKLVRDHQLTCLP